MSYLVIPAKKVLTDLRPLATKTTEEISLEIFNIRKESEKLLAASRRDLPLVDLILTQDTIRKTRKNLENCLNELRYRN